MRTVSKIPRPRLLASSLVVVLAAGTVLSGCGSDDSGTPVESGGPATVGTTGDYATLDFQTQATPTVLGYSFPGYDRLVGYTADKSELVPYLAKSWTLTPQDSPTSVTFTLRDDAVCPDGAKITPQVVMDSMQRFLSVTKITNRIPNLFGAGPFDMSADNNAGTFTWTTKTPFVNVLHGFAQTGIICPAGLEALKTDPDALTKTQYGSGPYELTSAQSGVEVVWKKRKTWTWGPDGTNHTTLPDTLTYKVVVDATTLANLILTNGVDFGPVNGPDIKRLAENDALQEKVVRNNASALFLFNMNPGRVTRELNVRLAIMTAIDPQGALKTAGGYGTADASFIAPDAPCYSKTTNDLLPKTSIEDARQLLQDAGYTPGDDGIMQKDGQRLAVHFVTQQDLRGLADYVSSQLKTAGFDVRVDNLTYAEKANSYSKQDFDFTTSSSLGFDRQQAFNIGLFSGPPPPDGGNRGWVGGGDPEYDAAAVAATQSTDCAPLEKITSLMIDKAYLMPLYFPDVYAFGNQTWDFPSVLNGMEIVWLKRKA